MRFARAATAIALTLPTLAVAGGMTFPTRSGESGLADVPEAEVVPMGAGHFGAEVRYDHSEGLPDDVAPLPIFAVAGMGASSEVGFSMREWGQPGDKRPSRLLLGAALKYRVFAAGESFPALALGLNLDRVNGPEVLGGRVIASMALGERLHLAAFLGGEAGPIRLTEARPTYGAALGVNLRPSTDAIGEALSGPRGTNLGAMLRHQLTPTYGVSLGVNYFPGERGLRVTFGIGFGTPSARRGETDTESAVPVPVPKEEEEDSRHLAFTTERPRFRLKLHLAGVPLEVVRRHQQSASTSLVALARSGAVAAPSLPARPVTPSADELLAARLAEQDAAAGARMRRLRTADERLDARASGVTSEEARLAGRERDLVTRETELETREGRADRRRAPSGPREGELQQLASQLAGRERQLAAEERSIQPTVDAALGRERDALARESAERDESEQLAAAARSGNLDKRKQELEARARQIAAYELRLVAKGERLDAEEQRLRMRSERLDIMGQRLDGTAERIALLEHRPAQTAIAAEPTPRPDEAARGPGKKPDAPQDKAVFVMVVKSPTAIVKGALAGGSTPSGPASRAAVSPGAAVERAVSAAAVVNFATAASAASELDLESVDRVVKLAARDGAELLVWARAGDPALMAEAQRRADQLKTRASSIAPSLPPERIVSRVTQRPGTRGVDVVVSAVQQRAGGPAAGAAPSSPAAGAGAADAAVPGDSARRQIREAVIAAQPELEACVQNQLQRSQLSRAELVLKLTVTPAGGIVGVVASGDAAGDPEFQACVARSATRWRFPAAAAEYVVDVPITVLRGGEAK